MTKLMVIEASLPHSSTGLGRVSALRNTHQFFISELHEISWLAQVHCMSETKKVPELIETSLAYVLSAVAALLAFLLVWLICAVAGFYRA